MIDHRALSVSAAGARAGVLALGPYAGQVRRAVGVDGALWSASFVGIPYVIWSTGAGARAVLLSADRVGTAG